MNSEQHLRKLISMDKLTNTDYRTLKATIVKRVEELLGKNKQLLFSFLYRMDVSEAQIRACLSAADPVEELADAIIQRQLRRIDHKNKTQVNKEINDIDLQW